MLFTIFLLLSGAMIGFVAPEEPPSPKDLNLYMKNVDDCKAAELPTEADVNFLLNFTASIELVTPKGKCFMGCLMERTGFLKNGVIPRAEIEKLIKKKMTETDGDAALQYLDMCEKDMVGVSKDKCDAGPVLVQCIRKFEATVISPHILNPNPQSAADFEKPIGNPSWKGKEDFGAHGLSVCVNLIEGKK